ncbi:MAG: DUF1611 domain-containing protein [Alphaproteobacteria bacterium]|nr:DUF1611 domain-containing protein [Alphaproteobacteria bacterium]
MSAPRQPDGDAVVWCQGHFNTPNGKTAHGLVRFTERYRVRAVIDDRYAGQDAGDVLDGRPRGIPVVESLQAALAFKPTHFVVGLAPDGGRLTGPDRQAARDALDAGLNVDCGLHDLLSDDPDLVALAEARGVTIRDVRRPPPASVMHHFSGRINEVGAVRIAVLGTDSAVGKRTTAVLLVQALRARGVRAELIGTGQTAWMQGVPYSFVMDSLISDFMSGEIEHAVVQAWDEVRPEVIVIEGQGSLMNPAYPGGYEILAAARPHGVVMQHAPTRVEYDGFPGFRIQPLETQIQAIELISGRPVVAITINHEGMDRAQALAAVEVYERQHHRPTCAPLLQGVEPILDALLALGGDG